MAKNGSKRRNGVVKAEFGGTEHESGACGGGACCPTPPFGSVHCSWFGEMMKPPWFLLTGEHEIGVLMQVRWECCPCRTRVSSLERTREWASLSGMRCWMTIDEDVDADDDEEDDA